MKNLLALFTILISLCSTYAQSIELDHTEPSLKIMDNDDDIGIHLGNYIPAPYLDGYHLMREWLPPFDFRHPRLEGGYGKQTGY